MMLSHQHFSSHFGDDITASGRRKIGVIARDGAFRALRLSEPSSLPSVKSATDSTSSLLAGCGLKQSLPLFSAADN